MDHPANPSSNPHIVELAELASPDRRRVLLGTLSAAALPLLGAPLTTLAAGSGRVARPAIDFSAITVSTADGVAVPDGYQAHLLYAWGDPVSQGPFALPDASDSAVLQSIQAGMHHDGMAYFPFVQQGRVQSNHGLLCINHEYTDDGLLHRDGMQNWSKEKVDKAKAAVGVSVIEVERSATGSAWQVVRPSVWGRRITADTPCRISGPAAGHPLMRTAADQRGTSVIGTFDNCAMGQTPWGTYLTCEENFNGFFVGPESPDADQKRYGIGPKNAGFRWHEHDPRFRVSEHPNEAHRFGWVVEIDPWNPHAAPVKRTALGRFKHEGATVTLAADGRVVVYMGDDERFEYIYKFVSRDAYLPGDRKLNADLLDHGTLYVAEFNEDGSGRWQALTHGAKFAKGSLTAENGFASQGDIAIRCRQAADLAGATRMDRPEWIAVHPQSGEAYVSLTNNKSRGNPETPGLNAANSRADNIFGHILRWKEAAGNAAATNFTWDIFALAGDPKHPDPNKRGNIRGDAYGSPDGLWFDRDGRLWIQTDVSASVLNQGDYANLGNNQMLAADVVSGETRRFLTGPRGCEITGIAGTPDGCTLFVNIQHPGETGSGRSNPETPLAVSAWPANQFPQAVGGRPRSATIVITRADGGKIGV